MTHAQHTHTREILMSGPEPAGQKNGVSDAASQHHLPSLPAHSPRTPEELCGGAALGSGLSAASPGCIRCRCREFSEPSPPAAAAAALAAAAVPVSGMLSISEERRKVKIFSGKLDRGVASQEEGRAWGWRGGRRASEGRAVCGESDVKVVGAAAEDPLVLRSRMERSHPTTTEEGQREGGRGRGEGGGGLGDTSFNLLRSTLGGKGGFNGGPGGRTHDGIVTFSTNANSLNHHHRVVF